MSTPGEFRQKLSKIRRLYRRAEYDRALADVESLLVQWPGNAQLHILRADLIQLQVEPQHELEEAGKSLQQAVELDDGSAAAAIELAHYLDNVEDDLPAAAHQYAEGVSAARQLLIDGLIGQAKVMKQLGQREEARRCLVEVLQLTQLNPASGTSRRGRTGADIIFESPAGHFHAVELKGPYADQIQELLNDVVGAPAE